MAKVPFTVRVLPAHLEGLQRLAAEKDRTMSMLVATAIEEYLARQNMDLADVTNHVDAQVSLDAEDVRRVVPVVEAFGKPMSLSLFVQVMLAQRDE